jgi:hypothetical protein
VIAIPWWPCVDFRLRCHSQNAAPYWLVAPELEVGRRRGERSGALVRDVRVALYLVVGRGYGGSPFAGGREEMKTACRHIQPGVAEAHSLVQVPSSVTETLVVDLAMESTLGSQFVSIALHLNDACLHEHFRFGLQGQQL